MDSIIINDLNQLAEEVIRRVSKATEPRTIAAIAEVVQTAVEDNFQASGRTNGGSGFLDGGFGKWKELSKQTVSERKQRDYYPINILRRTALLKNSIAVRPSGGTITISSNLRYAAVHQFGYDGTANVTITSKMRRFFWAKFFESGDDMYKWMALTKKTSFARKYSIPARPFLQITQSDLEEIKLTILQALQA